MAKLRKTSVPNSVPNLVRYPLATIAVDGAMAFEILISQSFDTLLQAPLAHANQIGHRLMTSFASMVFDRFFRSSSKVLFNKFGDLQYKSNSQLIALWTAQGKTCWNSFILKIMFSIAFHSLCVMYLSKFPISLPSYSDLFVKLAWLISITTEVSAGLFCCGTCFAAGSSEREFYLSFDSL